MKLLLGFILFMSSQTVQARPEYLNTFVPQALNNLGLNTTGWNANCRTCHGTTEAFGNFNAGFGTQFRDQALAFGFTLTANNATDMTQPQIEQIINALRSVDSDGDGSSNQAEWIARTNVNGPDQASNNCDIIPELCQNNKQNEMNGNLVSVDEAYQLNSSCASQDNFDGTAKASAPLGGVFFLWAWPFLLVLIRRFR